MYDYSLMGISNVIVLILLLLPEYHLYSQEDVRYDLQPLEDNKFKITWNFPENSKVYISFLGSQKPAGEQIVVPKYDTDYTLIAEISDQTIIKTLTAPVPGAKGDDHCPSESVYTQFQYRYQAPPDIQITDFLSLIRTGLQEELDFSIIEDHHNKDEKYVFVTACSQRDYLLKPDETTIGARTIAYRVELLLSEKETKSIDYIIKCAIRYRKKVVRTWRREDNENLHLTEARRLKEVLDELIR